MMVPGKGISDLEANAAPAIEARGFGLTFPARKRNGPVHVLRDIDLMVTPGEIITIIGPSGCGKTSLLRAVAGLLTHEDDHVQLVGSVSVHGLSPAEAKKRRFFAFTFQNPVLLPWRTVRQNVNLPLEIAAGSTTTDPSIVDSMLAMVGIGDFAASMPSQISGGMQQRVNLARALVQEPRILLMDEPFGNLDEVTRERLNFELLRIQRLKRQTILFVTHSISEAVLLGDRVLVLSERPASIRDTRVIQLPRDRSDDMLSSNEYLATVRDVREMFAREEPAQ